MIKDITFFHTVEELEAITGLTRGELWDNGFNLDDIDWGIVTTNVNLVEEIIDKGIGLRILTVDGDNNEPYIIQLLRWMEDYHAGWDYVEYNDRQFFLLHHT